MQQGSPNLHKYDLLIVGGGFAGLQAAWAALESAPSLKVGVLSRNVPGASGASAVSMSVHRFAPQHPRLFKAHKQRFYNSALGLADAVLAEKLLAEGAEASLRLTELCSGLTVKQEEFAGQSYPYLVAAPERLGLYLLRPLAKAVAQAGCEFLAHHTVLSVRRSDEVWELLVDTREGLATLSARAVILATGGATALYLRNSGTRDLCGSALAWGMGLGLNLRDMECVQFYPYRVFSPTICDIFPDVFSYGARLLTQDGRRFMDAHPKKELENRDILAREIAALGEVELDLGHCDCAQLEHDSPPLFWLRQNYAPPYRVRVTTHHTMGGLMIDSNTRLGLPGLFACGEAVGGVHGANRLAGHALTDCAVFGRLAGLYATSWLEHAPAFPANSRLGLPWALPALGQGEVAPLRSRLVSLMWERAGVIRTEEGLALGLKELSDLEHAHGALCPQQPTQWIILGNMLMVARAVLESAQLRRESRGAHFRADYPGTEPKAHSIGYNAKVGAFFL